MFVLLPMFFGLRTLPAEEYSASCHITEPLSQFILDRGTNSAIVKTKQLSRKSAIRNSKSSNYSDRSFSLRTHLDPSSQRALDLASAKGASNWLTTRPLQEHGFALHKSAFHDAVALRYGWSPQRTPAHCACGTSFSVEHALSCPKGGLPSTLLKLRCYHDTYDFLKIKGCCCNTPENNNHHKRFIVTLTIL